MSEKMRVAARQALEAMETTQHSVADQAPHRDVMAHNAAIAALRAALAEPEPELLDEVEVMGLTCECVDDGNFNMSCALDFARAIERKSRGWPAWVSVAKAAEDAPDR